MYGRFRGTISAFMLWQLVAPWSAVGPRPEHDPPLEDGDPQAEGLMTNRQVPIFWHVTKVLKSQLPNLGCANRGAVLAFPS